MNQTALIVCPGRGSYLKEHLGSLQFPSAVLDVADHYRREKSLPTVRELDAKQRFSGRFHLAGEHASILTASAGLADYAQINLDAFDPIGVCGNSMGHYTALGISGALSIEDTLHLIDTMGAYQKSNVIGGQIVYPIFTDDWGIDSNKWASVQQALEEIKGLHVSIYLGQQMVLAGTDSVLAQAISVLPELTIKGRTYPLKLPFHSAFHTPLLADTATKAVEDLQALQWQPPELPLIDGTGAIWKPKACSVSALIDYTLGTQITETYHFNRMIQTAVSHFAPDKIILLGPGSNLGGAIGQALIDIKWKGLANKSDFISMQSKDPFVIAMGRAKQRPIVIGSHL